MSYINLLLQIINVKSVVTNYRPISLVACFSKMFEKVIVVHVTDFLLRNNILNPNQFGFVPNKSISDQLHNLCIFFGIFD